MSFSNTDETSAQPHPMRQLMVGCDVALKLLTVDGNCLNEVAKLKITPIGAKDHPFVRLWM